MSKSLKIKFLNPIYNYFPIVILAIAMHFLSVQKSVILSFSVSFIMFILVCFFRKSILFWNAFKYFLFLICYGIILFLCAKVPDKIVGVIPSIVFFVLLMFFLIFQQPIKKLLKKKQIAPRFYEEFFRLAKLFVFSFFIYIILFFLFLNKEKGQLVAEDVLSIMLVIIVIYEYVRETIIKINLNKEKWYPIVDEKGNVLGKVEKKESLLFSEQKYLHPIIRVHVIFNNTIYLGKSNTDDPAFSEKWDAAISNHVLFGETIDQCIARTAKLKYGLKDIKPIYLNKYVLETENEKQLAFVYYIEGLEDLKPVDEGSIQMGKYWTIKQITQELDAGIFTTNFVHEFEMLCKKIIYCGNLFEK